MTKSGVYKITNATNGKFYIGSSKDIEQRFHDHKRELRANTHPNPILQNSWNYYGEDKFTFEILEECQDPLVREQYYLDTFQPHKGVGFNINGTAVGGDCYTNNPNREAIIQKLKLIGMGENNAMFGKTHSKKTKEILKEKAKGRYSLEWFIQKYGQENGDKKYKERREFLANRKINYVYDNGLKGKKVKVEKTRGDSVRRGRMILKERKEEFLNDIKNKDLTTKYISEKYGISCGGVKYHRKKLQ